ncbi:LPXTG cell wall anchor domain-containing protein [Marininema halotolerans]|uniref:LPXTG-motif cell wall anchor domain-containing protein n=1 Tax=Marininema halotolerans TaxID=1155944 RepID=A0A1I6NUR6_9BACL|nr:LPXTG cell wall anchor domain-containing protein [Marininema halotolerans]SFS31634.1 LPXTG-motif cell wall anchor domain-containing protein [Marininema halotolerans]
MRRGWLAVLLAFMLLWIVSVPLTALAETGLTLTVTPEQKEDGMYVKASVSGDKVVEGTYTFNIADKKQSSNKGETTFKDLPAGKHQLNVSFTGKVDGVDQSLTSNMEVKVKAVNRGTPPIDIGNTKDGTGDKNQNSEKPQDINLGVYTLASIEPYTYEKRYLNINVSLVDANKNLIKANKAEGNWDIKLNGESKSEEGLQVSENGLKASQIFEVKPGKYNIEVTFTGKVDGKEVTLKEVVPFTMPEVIIDVTFDGKNTLDLKLTEAKEAEGIWNILLENDEGNVSYRFESDPHKGLSFSHKLDKLKPGTYTTWVGFKGTIDGYEGGLNRDTDITVKEDKASIITPIDDKDTPPASGTPKKKDKIANDIKPGKVMPKTGSDTPLFTLLGGVLVLVGLFLSGFLWKRRSFQG